MNRPAVPRTTSRLVYRVENLSKQYNGRPVLQIERLNVYRGEILGLVGPSGSGKSTLLRLLNFLEAPTAGRIQFMEKSVPAGDPIPLALRRRITTVFQRPVLLNRSVQANIAYGLNLRGIRDARPQISAALADVNLADLANQRARTLSGGEAQRVALARAMVLRPEVLLLDEPTANLDPYNVSVIEENITRMNRDNGMTIVLVTHNVFQARRLAHRVAFLLDGQLVETAATHDFFESPQDARTRAFVNGEMVY